MQYNSRSEEFHWRAAKNKCYDLMCKIISDIHNCICYIEGEVMSTAIGPMQCAARDGHPWTVVPSPT